MAEGRSHRQRDSSLLVLDGVAYGLLLAGYVLLFALHGSPWPPAGHELLPGGGGIVCAALALVTLLVGMITLRSLRTDWRVATLAGAAALLLLQAASARALWLLFIDTEPMRDPYGAILWGIALYLHAHLALSALMLLRAAIALLAQHRHRQCARTLGQAVLLSHFTAILMLVGLALLAVIPRLMGGNAA